METPTPKTTHAASLFLQTEARCLGGEQTEAAAALMCTAANGCLGAEDAPKW